VVSAGYGRGREKDSTIKHVMVPGLNPQGPAACDFRFKAALRGRILDHDFLWRATRSLPARGKIRYFQSLLLTRKCSWFRVHPEILSAGRNCRWDLVSGKSGRGRFDDINAYETLSQPETESFCPEVLPERLKEGAKKAIPRTAGRAREKLEIFPRADVLERQALE